MLIQIKNFKCWYSKELEVKDEGIILLSGRSGKGKSSILDAVFFCLFGEGKKVVSHGKTTCEVIIHVDDMTITRTNRPNRLHLISDQGEFEDEVAQSIINEHFGELFDVVSYVKQNGYNTFLKMSPTEKLEFIERALFQHTNIGDLKKKTKDYISECNDNLVTCVSRIATLKEMLSTLTLPEKESFPFKVKKEDYEKVEKNEHVKKKNSEILLKKKRVELNTLSSLENSLNLYFQSQKNKEKMIHKYDEDLKELNLQKSRILKTFRGEDNISLLNDIKKYFKSRQKIDELNTRLIEDTKNFENMKWSEIKENTNERENLEKMLNEHNKDELMKNLETNKQYFIDLKRLKTLKESYIEVSEKDIKDSKNKLEKERQKYQDIQKQKDILIKSKDILTCPHCENSVILTENGLEKSEFLEIENIELKLTELEKYEKEVQKNIKTVETKYTNDLKNYEKMRTIKEDIKEIEDQYEGLSEFEVSEIEDLISETKDEISQDEKFLSEINNYETKLKETITKIEKNIFSKSLLSLQKNLERLQKEYNELEDEYGENKYTNYTLELTEKELIEQSEIFSSLNNLVLQIKNLTDLKSKLNEEKIKEEIFLKESCNLNDIPTLDKVKKDIDKVRNEITELNEKFEKTTANILQIEKYKMYITSKENYDNICEKINKDEKEEKEYRSLLTGSNMLKDKISEAQSIAITNFIDSLNAHVNLHLETFFRDDPMTIEIETFKETKNNKGPSKPQINLKIDYKGMDCDTNSLSGGERDRLDLALTLALAEIFGSRILLLDECISSLDYETSAHVLEGLKDNYKGKSVIVVSHQANEGDFDEVINI